MNMLLKHYIKRAIYSVIIIFAVITFDFLLFRLLPGNPIETLYANTVLTPQQIASLSAQFGLTKPVWIQYFIFVKNLFQGNFGISFFYKEPVSELLFPSIINSVILLLPAVITAIVIGIYTGKYAAWHRGKKRDYAVYTVSMSLYAIPSYWLGAVLIMLAIFLKFHAITGMHTAGVVFSSPISSLADLLRHMLLPYITLTLVLFGGYALMMRNSLINVLSEDYIAFAKSKGASDRYILNSHALPNAMLPMVTMIAIAIGFTVAGGMLIETVFNWPGVGWLIYDSIFARDYPILQGAFLVIAISVVLANFVADIVYGYLDPRIKYSERE